MATKKTGRRRGRPTKGESAQIQLERDVETPDMVGEIGEEEGFIVQALVGVGEGLTVRERTFARLLAMDSFSETDLSKLLKMDRGTVKKLKCRQDVLEHADRLRLLKRVKNVSRRMKMDNLLDRSVKVLDKLLVKAMREPGEKDPLNPRKKLPVMKDGDRIRVLQIMMDRHPAADLVKRTRLDVAPGGGVFDGAALVDLKKSAALLEGPESQGSPAVIGETSVEEDAALLAAAASRQPQRVKEEPEDGVE